MGEKNLQILEEARDKSRDAHPILEELKDLAPSAPDLWLENLKRSGNPERINELLAKFIAIQIEVMAQVKPMPFYDVSKRLFDIVVSLTAILLLSPVFLIAALAVKASSRGPVIYKQSRVGKNFTPFTIYKFRSMSVEKRLDDLGSNEMSGYLFKMKDDPRVTVVGKILRRWSIDELPQLFNILRGDMSFVGPRPVTLEDNAIIPAELYMRFAVVPGLTGLWQSICRQSRDGEEKLKLDCDYVRIRGWETDIVILLRTLPSVLKGNGL